MTTPLDWQLTCLFGVLPRWDFLYIVLSYVNNNRVCSLVENEFIIIIIISCQIQLQRETSFGYSNPIQNMKTILNTLFFSVLNRSAVNNVDWVL